LWDREFCRRWTLGIENLQAACKDFTPEKTASLTGVHAKDIIAAGRFFAQSKPAGVIWGVGVDMHPGCLGTIHGLIGLMAMTGNVENPGGMVLTSDPFGVKRRGDDLGDFPQIKTRRIGADRYPLIEVGNPYGQPDVLLDQIESDQPYPLKAAWIQGAGIIPSGFADPQRVLRLFGKLDFTVMADVFLNPAAVAFADLVLPAAMYPEKDSLYVHYSQLGAINKAVDPPEECRSDAQIILDVGRKVAPRHFPWDKVQEWLDYRLKPSGMTFADLKEAGSLTPRLEYARHEKGALRGDGSPGFATPSGKIELRSSVLAGAGLEDLPYWDDCVKRYRLRYDREDYPFILTTGARKSYYFCAEGRQVASLRRHQPEPLVNLNSQDALKLGIIEGQEVEISSPFGSCRMNAHLSEAFAPGVVHCDFGWWFPEKPAAMPSLFEVDRANVNALLPSGLQGPSGMGYPFRAFICAVKPGKSR
jgi:anaerobic selenocysteine-containing dehydrogenase